MSSHIHNYGSHSHAWIDPRTLPNAALTKAASDAYDEVMSDIRATTTKEKNAMSTLQKVLAERREKRERAEVEALFEAWDQASVDAYADGTVVTWTWKPEGKDRIYKYAALWTNQLWYITGPSSPTCGQDAEEWISWMIEKKVWPEATRVIPPEEQS